MPWTVEMVHDARRAALVSSSLNACFQKSSDTRKTRLRKRMKPGSSCHSGGRNGAVMALACLSDSDRFSRNKSAP